VDRLHALADIVVVGGADEVDLLRSAGIADVDDVDAALLALRLEEGAQLGVLAEHADVRDPPVL
jgi:hypothetical protein